MELWPCAPPKEGEPEVETKGKVAEKFPEISSNAMARQCHPSTIWVQGHCLGRQFILLVDGGSTHSFIKTSTIEGLRLTMEEISSFRVCVGSGDFILCKARCSQSPIQIQGYNFVVDFFVLDMRGANMVLGVQWLETLEVVCTHYKDLTMEFNCDG